MTPGPGHRSLDSIPPGRGHDKIQAAYKGLSGQAKQQIKALLQDPDKTPEEVASALRDLGYDIERRHVLVFRAKLGKGKVKL